MMSEKGYKQFKRTNKVLNYLLYFLALYVACVVTFNPHWFLYWGERYGVEYHYDLKAFKNITYENEAILKDAKPSINCNSSYVNDPKIQNNSKIMIVKRFYWQTCALENLPTGRENIYVREKDPFVYWIITNQAYLVGALLLFMIFEQWIYYKHQEGIFWLIKTQ